MSEKTLMDLTSTAIQAKPSQMADIYDNEDSEETMTDESSEQDAEVDAKEHNDEELKEICK